MLGPVSEEGPEDATQGSVLSFCSGLLAAAGRAADALQAGSEGADDHLELMRLWADQAVAALERCQQRFKSSLETQQRADALKGSVQGLRKATAEVAAQRKRQAAKGPVATNGGLFSCFSGAKTAPAGGSPAALRKLDAAIEGLGGAIGLIRATDTAGEEHYVFAVWQPGLLQAADAFYKPPVAYDTVTTYLLGQKLPARLLVHGASGNGKTSLVRQLQLAVNDPGSPLHGELGARFPGGLKWVDCAFTKEAASPAFLTEVKARALTLAQDLLPSEDERLVQMDLPTLAAVIRERITNAPFLVVFDNVWDGGLFRRDCLNVLPEDIPGKPQQGTIIVTSQFNLAAACQWYSPETISIPLSQESNLSACVSLLASLWSGDPKADTLPPHLEPLGRQLVRECRGSPLAVRLLAPLLEGSPREKAWRDVLDGLRRLAEAPTIKVDTTNAEDQYPELSPVLFAFQLRARALPQAMRQLLAVLGLFPPAQPVPVAAVLAVFGQVSGWGLEEACVLLRALVGACLVEIRAPLGQMLSGTAVYHRLLQRFLASAPDFNATQLPGSATAATQLCLASVALYASPAYRQQATQVFSKLAAEEGRVVAWQPPPRMRRNPHLEPFWLQLLQLASDPELGPAAEVPVVAAARQQLAPRELADALCALFVDPRGLLPAAGVFSELCWQVEDRGVLQDIANKLDDARAVSRIVIRLRELTVREGGMAEAEELAVLAWALADLAEFVDASMARKLRSDPLLPSLETQYQGAGMYAYQRLAETLGL